MIFVSEKYYSVQTFFILLCINVFNIAVVGQLNANNCNRSYPGLDHPKSIHCYHGKCARMDTRTQQWKALDLAKLSKRDRVGLSQYSSSISYGCKCDKGWKGLLCDTCTQRVRLNNSHGYIYESVGRNYTVHNKCSWLIDACHLGTKPVIHLHILRFATECTWDHLYIYDGTSIRAPLLAAFSGLLLKDDVNLNFKTPVVTARSGYAYLYFYSDASYSMSGFNITYVVNACLKNCSGHGHCTEDGFCVCNPPYSGAYCEIENCPHNCSNRGKCVNGKCECEENIVGYDCSLSARRSSWSSTTVRGQIDGRASHGSVMTDHHLWVVLGYTLNVFNSPVVSKLDMNSHIWKNVLPIGIQPLARYGISLVNYDHKLYMFGGQLENHVISSELWAFFKKNSTWVNVTQSGVIAVAGHSAHIWNGQMFVFMGQSNDHSLLSFVQHCDLRSKNVNLVHNFTILETTGVLIKGSYGHTSALDESTSTVYVHAGYRAINSTLFGLSDELYSFDLKQYRWSILRSSAVPRYLHSSVIMDNFMLVYGGNTHNDTKISFGAKCFSCNFMAYDISCDRWHVLAEPFLPVEVARYGHSAHVYKNHEMVIFGGFHGVMLNSTIRFLLGNCSVARNSKECNDTAEFRKCRWENSKCVPDESCTSEPTSRPCKDQLDCSKCQSQSRCHWCNGVCVKKMKNVLSNGCLNSTLSCNKCSFLFNCKACNALPSCEWNNKSLSCMIRSKALRLKLVEQDWCQAPSYEYTTCENCISAKYMWCAHTNVCIESISYLASFPYAQCLEWTINQDKCPSMRCEDLKTCDTCQESPGCGWCNNVLDTGLGQCLPGSALKPFDHQNCPADRWHFTTCPLCQCNGHSKCLSSSSSECYKCRNNTTGPQCESCADGYFGEATRNGTCKPCNCSGQADLCNHTTGTCFCLTKGVKGKQCDQCDSKYFGNPSQPGGTCYYRLTIDYQYTFNMTQKDETYYTKIHFKNVPNETNRDVEFAIECSKDALMNISFKSVESDKPRPIVTRANCKNYKQKFPYNDYQFGGDTNATFIISVYNFTTSFAVLISFSQIPQIDLLHFFVTFFSCFLSLLLLAIILWKVKQKLNRYRRRQHMFAQMEQMASRPFSVCSVEISPDSEPLLSKREELSSRKRKAIMHCSNPSPVALEPLLGHKAAVLSLLVHLPTGDEEYTPSSVSGVAIGSALVTLGNPRKSNSDHVKVDKKKKIISNSNENWV